MLLVTGPVTKNMENALRIAYDCTPDPKLVVAVGDCGCNGGVFGESYASCGAVATWSGRCARARLPADAAGPDAGHPGGGAHGEVDLSGRCRPGVKVGAGATAPGRAALPDRAPPRR
jgi:hypothetical protein